MLYTYIRCKKTRRFCLLKNLLVSITFLVFLFLIVRWLFPTKISIPSFVALLAVLLSRDLLMFNVQQVTLDVDKRTISFLMRSIFSGEQQKSFPLDTIRSASLSNTSLNKWLNGPVTLQLQVSGKRYFHLTSRYGFKASDLVQMEQVIKDEVVAQTN